MRLVSNFMSLCLALAVVGCAASTDSTEEAPAESEEALRNKDDHLVERLFDRLASTNPAGTGVDAWQVYLVETKAGERYTVARGVRGGVEVVDVDLSASREGVPALQPLVSGSSYRIDADRMLDIARDLDKLARQMDRRSCKVDRAAHAIIYGVGAILGGASSFVVCGAAVVNPVAAGAPCFVLASFTASFAGTSVHDVTSRSSCDALPR